MGIAGTTGTDWVTAGCELRKLRLRLPKSRKPSLPGRRPCGTGCTLAVSTGAELIAFARAVGSGGTTAGLLTRGPMLSERKPGEKFRGSAGTTGGALTAGLVSEERVPRKFREPESALRTESRNGGRETVELRNEVVLVGE